MRNITNNKTPYIVVTVLVLAVIGGGLFLFFGSKGTQKETPVPSNEEKATESVTTTPAVEEMVDCGKAEDPSCFLSRMNGCLPVTAKMVGTDGKTNIEITVLGIENDKCHFQRKINDVLDLDCRFPKGTMNMDTLDQTFGNDKGLQEVVDDACKPAGW